jgi:hypothetical protein
LNGPSFSQLELSTLPPAALIKYLNHYNLTPIIQPSPLSARYPHPPHLALLNPSANPVLASSTTRNYPSYGTNGSGRRENGETAEATTIKGTVVKPTTVKNSNGVTSGTPTAAYSTTSALGLSATNGSAPFLDITAMYDVDEASSALVQLAHNHWSSIGLSNHGYGTGATRMNEKDVIDEFYGALRCKGLCLFLFDTAVRRKLTSLDIELAIRLT